MNLIHRDEQVCMMRLNNYFIMVLLLIHFRVSLAGAQEERTFARFTMEDGLSHNTVYSVVQDRLGFLWLATEGGLDRFDGFSFQPHLYDPLDTNTIPLSNSNVLLSDHDGNIWVGTWGGGLAKYDVTANTFTRYGNNPLNSSSLSDNRIQALFEDHAGNLWIGTYSGGLNRFNEQTKTFTYYKHDPGNPLSLTSNRIWSLAEDDNHRLWIGTNNGLCGISLDSLQERRFLSYRHEPGNPASLSHNVIRVLYLDHQGSLWIGTQRGLNRKHEGRKGFDRFFADSDNPKSLSADVINCITEDSSGSLWVGTFQGGLNQLDLNNVSAGFRRFSYKPDNPASLSHNDIRCIFMDRSFNLWVSTRGGGVSKTDLKPRKFSLVTDFKHISNERIWAIFSHESPGENSLWLGTDKGLLQIDSIRGQITLFQTGVKKNNTINNNYIRALHQDEDRVLWIGTSGGGLNRYDLNTRRFSYLVNDPDNPNSLSDNRIRVIFEEVDVPGKPLWIGTYGGLNQYDRSAKTWRRFNYSSADSHSISHDEIRVIFKDRKGILWVGTFGGGLNRWDAVRQRFIRYKSEPGRPDGLNSNDILCLADDPDTSQHVIWIGTDGRGLNRFDVASTSFTHITSADGLPNNVIYGIISGRAGNLWISTNRGLCKFNPRNHAFHNYDIRDGLQSNIFGQGAAFKNRKHIIFFGGLKGINYFDPARVDNNPFVPPVAITAFKIFDREDRRSFLQQQHRKLSYEDYFFTIEFAAMDFTIPEKNLYAYRLKGFDIDWIPSGNRRYASYTNVEPGSYLFEVIASNNDGLWNDTGLSIAITITPPFWKTWWFKVLSVLVMLGSAAYWYTARIRKIERQKNILEQQVSERTKELRQKSELLESANLELVKLNDQKNEFLGIAAHDLRNPLGAIIGYLDLILMDLKANTLSIPDTIADIEMVLNSARQMVNLITELLDISAIESGKVNLEIQRHNLNQVFEECERIHKKAASQKRINLIVDKNDQLPEVMIDKSRIAEVVDNLLSNAIKYTYPDGQVRLYTELRPREICVHVQDSGQGLNDRDLQEVFRSFKKLSARPTGGESSTGFGLAIVKKIVELHKGHVWVESKVNQGSVFSFSIPV